MPSARGHLGRPAPFYPEPPGVCRGGDLAGDIPASEVPPTRVLPSLDHPPLWFQGPACVSPAPGVLSRKGTHWSGRRAWHSGPGPCCLSSLLRKSLQVCCGEPVPCQGSWGTELLGSERHCGQGCGCLLRAEQRSAGTLCPAPAPSP